MRPAYAIVPVGSVLAAGVLTTAACVVIAPRLTWLSLLGLANVYVLGAFTVAALSATILAVAVAPRACVPGALFDVAIRTAISAAWLPSLVILVMSRSMWSTVPAVLSATALTLAIRTFAGSPAHTGAASTAIPGLPSLALLDSAAAPRHIVAGFLAGILLEAGAVAMTGRSSVASALLCAVGAAVVVGALERDAIRRTRSVERALATFAFAVLFTIAALTPFLLHGFGGGDGTGGESQGTSAKSNPEGDGTGTPDHFKDLYPGVVLWPARSAHTMLVAPLPSMGPMLAGVTRRHPLSIPFYGAYWYFRRPYTEPPAHSLKLRGSPLENAFVSTGHVPIVMEARQNLGMFIDTHCCDRLQLAISNADRYAGTVNVEVILVNTSGTIPAAESLGVQPVTSAPASTSVGETLTYPLPRGQRLRRFDEIVVRFHLDGTRTDTSAKIAIESFLLVPKGV